MAKHRCRIWRWTALAVALLLVAGAALVFGGRTAAPLSANPPGATLTAASQGLDTVSVDATFDPVQSALSVRQTFSLVNRTGVAQRMLVLRAYPNAFQKEDTSPIATDEVYDSGYPDGFSAGSLRLETLGQLAPDGSEAALAWSYGDDAQTVLRVSLPTDWEPGATLALRAAYTVRIPQAAGRFGFSGGVWVLGNALLIPAPFEDGAYRTDAYNPIGDPFGSECRNYEVRVTAPDGYAVLGSGAASVAQPSDGLRVTSFEALATRDFALCLSRSFRTAEALVDGVLVSANALTDAHARALLDTARQALACYGARYGAYPYPTLSLCETDDPFQGEAYPSLVLIGSQALGAGGETLQQLIARQVALQWWACAVGVDAFNQPWQHQALAEFSLLDYWETRYGRDARDALQYTQVDTALRVTVAGDLTPGSPVDYFGDWTAYRTVVYGRGGAALCALDTAMDGALDGFLARYYQTFAFQLASRADFESLLAQYTGEDWSALLSDYLDTKM